MENEKQTICVCKSCRREYYKGSKAKSFSYSTCEICGLRKNCVYIKVKSEGIFPPKPKVMGIQNAKLI